MNPPKAFTRKPIGFGKQITTYSFNELNPDAVFISIQRTNIESKSQHYFNLTHFDIKYLSLFKKPNLVFIFLVFYFQLLIML